MKTRREFIQQACGSCLLLATGGALFLESCATTSGLQTFEGNEFTIPVTSFKDKQNIMINSKLKGNLMIRKKDDGSFESYSLVCTHRGGKVVEKNGALKCTRHGSEFNIDGKLTKGPAKSSLEMFQVSVQGDNVVVKV